MIRALLLYAATVAAALLAGALALGVPLDWVAYPVLCVEVAIAATWAGARIARHMTHRERQDLPHISADHADRLPVTRVTAELVAPQPRQIEAPKRELIR